MFDITVADNVPNGTQLQFNLTMVSGNHNWRHNFSLTAYAPVFKISNRITIHDEGTYKGNGNGRLDPGETASITFTYENEGGSTANDVNATLSTATQQYITISDPTVTTPTVNTHPSRL